jgi:signal transduction histidine kinase
VQVLTGGNAHGASVIVADRGPGVPEAEREHIFERFHRGSAAGSEGGFGLGLAIGRELAVRMGGELRLVDADPPCPGARFMLTLRPASSPGGREGDADRPTREWLDAAGATRS